MMYPDVIAAYTARRDAEVAMLEGLATHLRLTQQLRAAKRDHELPLAELVEDRALVARAATLDDGTGRLIWLAQSIALLRTLDSEAV